MRCKDSGNYIHQTSSALINLETAICPERLVCCRCQVLRFSFILFAQNFACTVFVTVDRARQDQKPVRHRPVCHVPPLREQCVALQLCAKCGAIGHGRLDWHESDGVDSDAVAVVEAAVAKAAADFPGVEDAAMASGDEIIEGRRAKSHSTEDAILHTIFDRILRGGDDGDLQPGTGSQRFFCMKCWQ